MAGEKVIGRRVKASSLLEVVIAMVMIIVVFGIAMMIYSNVMRLSLSQEKLRAAAILREAMIKAEQQKEPATESITIDNWKLEQEVKPYGGNTSLQQLHLVLLNEDGKQLSELNKVILVQDDAKQN